MTCHGCDGKGWVETAGGAMVHICPLCKGSGWAPTLITDQSNASSIPEPEQVVNVYQAGIGEVFQWLSKQPKADTDEGMWIFVGVKEWQVKLKEWGMEKGKWRNLALLHLNSNEGNV